jgi:hypothetical protein
VANGTASLPAMKERTCSRLLNCCVFSFTIILRG